MKANYFKMSLFLIALFVNPLSIWANTQNIEPKIKEVTVFYNQAQIHTEAMTSLKSGTSTIIMKGISDKMVENSVQVKTEGNGVVLLSVVPQTNFLTEQHISQQVSKLRDSLNIYLHRGQLLSNEKTVLEKEEAMILANQKIGGQDKALSVIEIREMADFYRARLTEIYHLKLKTEQSISLNTSNQTRLTRQIQDTRQSIKRPTKEIVLTFLAKSSTNLKIMLSYLVTDAGWTPSYDLRVQDTQSPVELNHRAFVRQKTGVDWKDVILKLSTADPTLGATMPILTRLDARFNKKTYVSQNMRMRSEDAKKSKEKDDLEDRSMSKGIDGYGSADIQAGESAADYTEVNSQKMATEFEIKLPYTVLTDDNATLVDVQNIEMKANYTYFLTPILDKSAFLAAQITDWQTYNLTSGDANVYFQGTFTGKTYLSTENPTDTLMVSLGRDNRVVVERKLLKEHNSQRLIGLYKKETRGYEISVRNNRNEAVNIVLRDAYVVSTDSRIEVELLNKDGASTSNETGKLEWRYRLNSGESRTNKFVYSVRYPKGEILSEVWAK
ncbi:MAG: mucoidy inhibitor MuiA family protein [Cytophagales bacterium]|nr:MAG: mucoidy inhibitor MuiA family protein [Cytophagales bacterium]TAF60582.1 MAG: mucoidy inhibitor MuiA family protein [Cytophagales bacterium]